MLHVSYLFCMNNLYFESDAGSDPSQRPLASQHARHEVKALLKVCGMARSFYLPFLQKPDCSVGSKVLL